MESGLIVIAWVGGMVWGAVFLIGAIGLVTGHVVINPRRVDWSVGEGRWLGAIFAFEGVFLGVATLVSVLQIAANISAPPVMLPILPFISLGGILAIFAVGRRHDSRNPAKRYWR